MNAMKRWLWVAMLGGAMGAACESQPNGVQARDGYGLDISGDAAEAAMPSPFSPAAAPGAQLRASAKLGWSRSSGEVAQASLGTLAEGRSGPMSASFDDRWTANVREERAPLTTPDVFYVPSPQPVVDKMLELANVRGGDVVYDLGCGDGRIVVSAAKRYAVEARGFDIDPERVAQARENVRRHRLEHLVTIEQKDLFTLDLSEADVVVLYLLPEVNKRLIPQLERLRPGAVVVSHAYPIGTVQPAKVVQVPVGDKTHLVYLWYAPIARQKE